MPRHYRSPCHRHHRHHRSPAAHALAGLAVALPVLAVVLVYVTIGPLVAAIVQGLAVALP